jgi:hypothetical protein
MIRTLTLVALCIFLLLVAAVTHAGPDPLVEIRYCGDPVRNADGSIRRRADVLRVFRKLYACPATKEFSGACPGWAIDHIFPLANGGCDAVWNLQWLPLAIKSCAGTICKDRWERSVYLR